MKNLKVTVCKKSDHYHQTEQEKAHMDELSHLIHGYQKKGDNLKTMVDKLNDHQHPQADGTDWCYESLKEMIKKLGL
ncbi:MAG: hypothetical protein OQK12_02605 [Motiliproteus sp.]|nr:hypothetical protein [Motiliproteus sp.]MCW9053126.1 hypothetical protein [Motiliproteus sp.]